MNKSIYRNIYYVKQNILYFFYYNKKNLILALLSIILGLCLGFFIGFGNFNGYSSINFFDKIFLRCLCGESFFWFFIKELLKFAFIIFLILAINCFSCLSFLNYLSFFYLSLKLAIDFTILICISNLSGILFSFIYFLLNLLIILMLSFIFLICKTSNNNNCGYKFSTYPYKTIILCFFIIVLLCLLLLLNTVVFSKFVCIDLS